MGKGKAKVSVKTKKTRQKAGARSGGLMTYRLAPIMKKKTNEHKNNNKET